MASVCKETEYKRLDPLNLFWSLWGLLHAEWCLAHGKSITHYVLGMNQNRQAGWGQGVGGDAVEHQTGQALCVYNNAMAHLTFTALFLTVTQGTVGLGKPRDSSGDRVFSTCGWHRTGPGLSPDS